MSCSKDKLKYNEYELMITNAESYSTVLINGKYHYLTKVYKQSVNKGDAIELTIEGAERNVTSKTLVEVYKGGKKKFSNMVVSPFFLSGHIEKKLTVNVQ